MLRQVITGVAEQHVNERRRGCELGVVSCHFELKIRWMCDDEVEPPINRREHVTLNDRDVRKAVRLAVSLRVFNGTWTNIGCNHFLGSRRGKDSDDSRTTAEIQNAICGFTSIGESLFVFKRFVDARCHVDPFAVQFDGRKQAIEDAGIGVVKPKRHHSNLPSNMGPETRYPRNAGGLLVLR